MTENGALIKASAISTITVTQMQHGHIQLRVILQIGKPQKTFKQTKKKKKSNSSLIHGLIIYLFFRSQKKKRKKIKNHECIRFAFFINKRGIKIDDTNPTIQMITPTRDRRREISAKGSPKRNPRGWHSPSPQHMAADALYPFSSLKFCNWEFSSTGREETR